MYLIIVARNQLALCDYLRQQFFEDPEVHLLLDRRWGQRRQRVQASETERRGGDRRREPRDDDLPTHGFVIVRRNHRVMELSEIEELLAEWRNQLEITSPVAITAPSCDQPSIPVPLLEIVPPLNRQGPPIENSAWNEKLAEAAKHLASREQFGTLRTGDFQQDQLGWQEVLKRVGIAGLRLPENGALCRSWQEFLQRERTNWLDETVKIRPATRGTRLDGVRHWLIVSRDQPDLFHYLARDFSEDKEVQVLLDRRWGKRRHRIQAAERERRRGDRRRQPEGWTVKLSEFYRGHRPSFLPLAVEPIPTLQTQREDGSSFFGRGRGPGRPEEVEGRALGMLAAGWPSPQPPRD